jgi:tetratricopeptide (TPR) repeat protein
VRARGVAAAVVAALAALGCASRAKPVAPRYQPAASVLEVVAMLRAHIPDDTYRFEPARDFTGRNVYRSALIRLESIERVHAESLRSGDLDDVIAFAKGRALERLRSYDLAAQSFHRAAERAGPLQQEARQAAALDEALAEAITIGYEPDRPLPPGVERPPAPPDPEQAVADYDRRAALLAAVSGQAKGTPLAPVVEEEVERTDEARAAYFVARRRLDPDGDVRALAELQRVVTRHRDSKNANRHVLALADLYAEVAQEYVDARPPESLWFDPATFQEYVDSASQLYEAVANQDGTPEKLEAARRLEAFLAFTLRVDSDRFTP